MSTLLAVVAAILIGAGAATVALVPRVFTAQGILRATVTALVVATISPSALPRSAKESLG